MLTRMLDPKYKLEHRVADHAAALYAISNDPYRGPMNTATPFENMTKPMQARC